MIYARVFLFNQSLINTHRKLSCLILPLDQYIIWQNAFLTLPIDLHPLFLITRLLYELYKRVFFPVSNCSWLTRMRMQTIQSKKETNYHSYNYCCLFYSSMAYVIAFREKTIICKRWYSILIVEQFPYICFALLCFADSNGNRRKYKETPSYVICLCIDTSDIYIYKQRYLMPNEEPHTHIYTPFSSIFGKKRKRICLYDV